MAIAKKHNLIVIEDCCQAYMTYYKDKLVGTIGDIGCFSMQQSKHMATGEGGITITNSEEYAMRMSFFTDKGWDNRGSWGARSYSFLGVNYRMNELTAAVGLAQMRKVKNVVARMHENGELLTQLIKDVKGIMPAPVTQGGRHSYWLYSFKVNDYDPECFAKALCAEGIPTGWAYTVDPIYLCTDALRKKRTFGNSSYPFDSHYTSREIEYKEGLCPVAEKELLRLVSIRFYDDWSKDDIKDAADAIRKVAEGINAE
jgi:perosamine synthetase